jgi:hypothetical protein
MTKDDYIYLLGIVSWFCMHTASPTQRKMAIAIMEKLFKEMKHD